jgi:hypothetical protein
LRAFTRVDGDSRGGFVAGLAWLESTWRFRPKPLKPIKPFKQQHARASARDRWKHRVVVFRNPKSNTEGLHEAWLGIAVVDLVGAEIIGCLSLEVLLAV